MNDYLLILDSVSGLKNGGTVGQIQKPFPSLSRGQVQRVLDSMVNTGIIFMTVETYGRTGKKVYRITEFAAMVCAGIATNYTQSL